MKTVTLPLPPSDEEDDVISHHDLVIILHASQGGAHLWLGEQTLPPLVDVAHQLRHLHRLGVSRLEDGEQRRLEFFQSSGRKREDVQITQMSFKVFA